MIGIRKASLTLAVLAVPLCGCEDPTAWRDVLPMNWYHTPSTSMEPTFPVGARFTAVSVKASDLKRGDVVIVQTSRGEDYIKRVAGLPSDTIALQYGIVILNGEPVEQTPAGRHVIEDEQIGRQEFQRLKEQFPGEADSHFILDQRESTGDDYREIALGKDQYFLLGDNRDNAADSRFDEVVRGLGVVSGSRITRKVRAGGEDD